MRLRFALFMIAIAVPLLALGCGSDDTLNPLATGTSGNTDSGAGLGPSHQACMDYCSALTTKAEGCDHYNDGNRCENICGFYAKSACAAEWKAYTDCMTERVKAKCITPEGSTKLALDVYGCNDVFSTWHQCRDDKHASPCPY